MKLPEISPSYGLFAQARVEPETITIFRGWTRLTTDNRGEMSAEPLQGLFCAETRLVSGYELLANGRPIRHRLSAQLSANEWSTTGAVIDSGDSGNLPEGTLPKGAIEVRILRKCERGLSERVFVKNNGVPKRRVHLELRLTCPISDTELAEEMKRTRILPGRGIFPRSKKVAGGFALYYERNFGKAAKTPVRELSPAFGKSELRAPKWITRAVEIRVGLSGECVRSKLQLKRGRRTSIHLWLILDSRQEAALELAYEPVINGVRLEAPPMEGLPPLPRAAADTPSDSLEIRSSNSTFDLLVGEAMTDLRSLRLPLFRSEQVPHPERYEGFIAGIPRYIGVFGRDTVISGWQSILFEPRFLEPALSRVALFQGRRYDPWRDEEPFRILHERRLDPEGQIGKINRNLYYGDVTSTPFWILALSSLFQWTGDRGLFERHRETFENCCRWILRRLKEGEGFIYYAPAQKGREDEIRNQAWKDSGDAIVDGNGRIRVPPLAVAEIQGYTYQALNEAAMFLEGTRTAISTGELREAASDLKSMFNRHFWIPEGKFYALALDAGGNPLKARASNIGHCLGSGILDENKVEAVVRGLMSEDLFSGWGVRTLSAENPGFDPFSYHRGSVWPVENAIIAEGMAWHGYREESNRIITGQLCLAALFQHMRLPEVIAGQKRCAEIPVPGVYNFGNLLQTWSVSAVSQFVQSILGLRPRADLGVIRLDPALPDWLSWLELRKLRIGTGSVRLRFWRESDGQSRWEVLENSSGLRVLQAAARKAA